MNRQLREALIFEIQFVSIMTRYPEIKDAASGSDMFFTVTRDRGEITAKSRLMTILRICDNNQIINPNDDSDSVAFDPHVI